MHSIVEGFSPSSGPSWRSWAGMLADVWHVHGASGARGEYVSPHARLFVVLDETDAAGIQLSDRPDPAVRPAGRLSYVPPGVRTWSFVERQTRLRHLDLHVDLGQFCARLGVSAGDGRFAAPRLMFDNERILALAQMLAAECVTPGLHDLYGESLATAMLVELFQFERGAQEVRGQLSPRRLRIATEYLEDRCLEAVRLQDVADAVDLSLSYFCSAFKASTGVTPHQWQMQARIERVKDLLRANGNNLSEVASLSGFADQAHMTRVFKQYVGHTPAAWRRGNGA